jgi:hypothetical protein
MEKSDYICSIQSMSLAIAHTFRRERLHRAHGDIARAAWQRRVRATLIGNRQRFVDLEALRVHREHE